MNKNPFRKSVYGKNASQQILGKFDQNASLKKGIVVCLLAAALLVSMVGMASADYIKWYMTDTASDVDGANYIMYKYAGVGTATPIEIGEGVSKVWSANASALVDCSFTDGTWTGWVDFTEENNLAVGETIKIEVGSLHPTTSVFTSEGSMTYTADSDQDGKSISISPGAFTVSEIHYLAVKITMTSGSVQVETNGGTRSDTYIKYPYGTPDYPVPELPTIILMSTGLLALFGYVVYRRRNGKAQ